MAATHLVRKSLFLDPQVLAQVTKLMKAKSEAEALRRLADQYVEQARFWKQMDKTAGAAKKGSFRP